MSVLAKLSKTLEFQLSVLSDSSLTGDELDSEIKRNKAITDTAKEITSLHKMVLEATKVQLEYGRDAIDQSLVTISETKEIDNG